MQSMLAANEYIQVVIAIRRFGFLVAHNLPAVFRSRNGRNGLRTDWATSPTIRSAPWSRGTAAAAKTTGDALRRFLCAARVLAAAHQTAAVLATAAHVPSSTGTILSDHMYVFAIVRADVAAIVGRIVSAFPGN